MNFRLKVVTDINGNKAYYAQVETAVEGKWLIIYDNSEGDILLGEAEKDSKLGMKTNPEAAKALCEYFYKTNYKPTVEYIEVKF